MRTWRRVSVAAVCAGCLWQAAAAARVPEAFGPPVSGATESVKPRAALPEETLPLGRPRDAAGATEKPAGTAGKFLEPGTLTTVGSLVLVIGLILGVAMLTRRAAQRSGGLWASLGPGGKAPSGILEVLGRYPVGRGCTLVLLKLDRRILLVSQSSGGKMGGVTMTTLAEVTDAEDVASILLKSRDAETDESARRFEHMLSDADRAFHRVRHGEVPVEGETSFAGVPRLVTSGTGRMQKRLERMRGTVLEVRA